MMDRRQFLIGLTASAATASSLTLENTDGVSLYSAAHPVRFPLVETPEIRGINKLVRPQELTEDALEQLVISITEAKEQVAARVFSQWVGNG